MFKALISVLIALFSFACHAVTVSCFSTNNTTVSGTQPWPFDTIVVTGWWVAGFWALPPPPLLGATAQVQGNVVTLDMYASDTALPPGITPQPQTDKGGYPGVVQVTVGPLAPGSYTLMTALHIVDSTGAVSDPCGPAAGPIGFTIEQATGSVEIATAVEFYDAALDHYFVSADPSEIAALDNGAFPGWERTGLSFNVFAPGKAGGVGVPVCRFYGLPAAGLDSHFYTANQSESAGIPATFHGAWQLESTDVFDIRLPDTVTGACATGFVPVYRMWNQRADSNHRFTTDSAVAASMKARGYVSEGWGPGPLGVAMCAPQ